MVEERREGSIAPRQEEFVQKTLEQGDWTANIDGFLEKLTNFDKLSEIQQKEVIIFFICFAEMEIGDRQPNALFEVIPNNNVALLYCGRMMNDWFVNKFDSSRHYGFQYHIAQAIKCIEKLVKEKIAQYLARYDISRALAAELAGINAAYIQRDEIEEALLNILMAAADE